MKLFHLSAVAAALLLLLILASSSPMSSVWGISVPQWKFMGPGSALDVQPFGMDVSSATNDVIKIGNAFLLATVNGGVWRTTDALTTQRPHWQNVFDSQPVTCSSMTTFHASAYKSGTIYAGCGASTSSQMGYKWNVRNTGDMSGFAVSADFGQTWRMAGFPPNYSVESILELPNGAVLVSVRGSFYNDTDGGIWSSSNIFDQSSWVKVFGLPTFGLKYDNVSSTIYASTAAAFAADGIYMSTDPSGSTWTSKSSGLVFSGNQQPFYSVLSLIPGKALFLGVMLAPQEYLRYGLGAGFGQVFYLNLTAPAATSSWAIVGAQPMNANPANPNQDCSYTCEIPDCCLTIDYDYAQKDRMGMTVNPLDDRYLYVSGNLGTLVFRVDWRRALNYQQPCTVNYTSGTCYNASVDLYIWKPMWNQDAPFRSDTTNNATPHVDTRNMFYDTDSDSLLLVSDGGVFVRSAPTQENQGFWRGWNGDIGTFEYLHASYDIAQDRWIAGAQDNFVHVSVVNAEGNPTANARTFTYGDGTWTTVDNSRSPARLYGANQFAYGLSFVLDNCTGDLHDSAQDVPLDKRGFPVRGLNGQDHRLEASFIPFFEAPFHANPVNPSMLYLWANMSVYGHDASTGPGMGFFKLDVTRLDSGPNATLVFPTNGNNIIDFVAGGVVNGQPTEDVIVGVSFDSLFTRYNGVTSVTKLPVTFSAPLSDHTVKSYCESKQAQQVVPCTVTDQMTWPNHGKSMSVAIHPDNAKIIAVTGWPQLMQNGGTEQIILTMDGGQTWATDLVSNLVQATGTIAMARPGALSFVRPSYLVVGTVSGNFALDYTQDRQWVRLGSFVEFPRVLVSYNNYYADHDILLVATMGRGVYKLAAASNNIKAAIDQFNSGKRMDEDKKKLALGFGISIPILFVILVFIVWRKTSASNKHAVEEVAAAENRPSTAYQPLEDRRQN